MVPSDVGRLEMSIPGHNQWVTQLLVAFSLSIFRDHAIPCDVTYLKIHLT